MVEFKRSDYDTATAGAAQRKLSFFFASFALYSLCGLCVNVLFAGAPIHYVENKNQWPAGFHFGAEFSSTRVFLRDASIYFIQYHEVISDDKSPKKLQSLANEAHVHGNGQLSRATFELKFLNALKPTITSSGRQKTLYNYYLGNDRSQWGQGAHAWEEVLYKEMYHGIDLKLYSSGDQMKYDWIVSPCADPRNINFIYNGIEDIDLLDENLIVTSKVGQVIETKPFAYQVVNGQQRVVPAAFDIDNGIVSFVFPQGYDTNYELVIDPFILFSSYSGSLLDNWGNAATPDSKGNLHSGGMVKGVLSQAGFPTTAGAYQQHHAGGEWDVGILKYDSVGANVLYVTYLGGSGAETPQSLVVNQNDELLILGATSSPDFPGTSGFKGGTDIDPLNGLPYDGGTDLFIARLSVDGSALLASTYLGGESNDGINFVSGSMFDEDKEESPLSRNYGDQLRGDIVTDANGFVYIASNTCSVDFPVVNSDPQAHFHGGTHDAVVAKLTPSLDIVWTRLMGGDSTDVALSIKIAATGNLFVAGGTASTNLAGMNGLNATARGGVDGWIAELSPDGDQIINATYVGTAAYDQVYFIDLSSTGDVLAYGQTMGSYPFTPGIYRNPNGGQFLHRFKPDLKSTVFSTVFGKGFRRPDISPTAFMVNDCGNIYMAGWGGVVNSTELGDIVRNYVGGSTTGLPTTPDAFKSASSGNDFYFMVLSPDATRLLYATFFGGQSSPTHVDGGTSRFSKDGVVYHAVCAGCGGNATDFPAINVPESRSRNRSNNCNNAAFKFDLSSLHAEINGTIKVCFPDPVVFKNTSVGGETFQWKFGDGTVATFDNKNDVTHFYSKPGHYIAKLKVIDNSTCIREDSTSIAVDVFKTDMHGGPDQAICEGSSVHLGGTGAVKYLWRTIDNRFTSTAADPVVAPEKSTNYYVTLTDAGGCVSKDTVIVDVVPGLEPAFEHERIYDCLTRPYIKVKNVSELKDNEEATFLFGDGTSSDELEAMHSYDRDGIYTVSLRVTKEFCVYQVSEDIPIVTLRIPNVITPGAEDGLNDTFKLVYGDSPAAKDGLTIALKIMNRWGTLVYESKDYQDDWRGADVDAGIYYYEAEIRGETQCKGWIHLIK